MTGENAAPAEMPGVKEIARLIDPTIWDDHLPTTTTGDILAFHQRRQASCRIARAILDLFAPILAENEAYRQNRHFVMGFNAGFEAACEQGLRAAAIRAEGE